MQNIWPEEITDENISDAENAVQEVNVDELQPEPVDISDIAEKQAIVNEQEIASTEEEGEL